MSSFTSVLGTLFSHEQEKHHFPGQKTDSLYFTSFYLTPSTQAKKKMLGGGLDPVFP